MPEREKYDNIIIKLCAKVHEKYPKINKRLSNVELYQLIEYFIERDNYNDAKRTEEETVLNVINYGGRECCDIDDVKEENAFCEKKLKKVEEDQSLLDLENRFVEGYNFDLKNIGDGQEKEVFDIKNKMFSTKKMQKSK